MANIRVDLTEPLLDGMDIKFKAPCDCTAVTGLIVYYRAEDDTLTSQTFTFKDAHGNSLSDLGNLFSQGVIVKVMVDRTTGSAYIQNADTNKYLEDKIANAGTKVTLSSSVSSTSTTTAANSYAVKQAYDKAVSANMKQYSDTITDYSDQNIVGASLNGVSVHIEQVGRLVTVIGKFEFSGNASSGYITFRNDFPNPVPPFNDANYIPIAAVSSSEDNVTMKASKSGSNVNTTTGVGWIGLSFEFSGSASAIYFSFSYVAAI